ncbi:YceI family protein, partial [bacterium]|nr:YceI family protein [bacterium]
MLKNRTVIGFILFIFVVASSFSSATADNFSMSQIYRIDRGHSYIEFSIKYMGFAKVRGRFSDFFGTMSFDGNDITRSSGTVFIKVDSIDTDHDMRDEDLRSDNWFDAKQYPLIKFQSKKIVKNGSRVEAIGELTIKNVTKEIMLTMDSSSGVQKDARGDTQVVLTGRTTINRNDFGVRGENWSK